jgi:fucose permease
VVASLLAGALREAGTGVVALFAGVGAALALAALALARMEGAPARVSATGAGLRALLHVPGWLAVLGGLTAVAYFVENAWQSWSAVHLETTLGASAGLAALGPALFASAAVTGRLLGQSLAGRVGDRALLRAGAAVAAAGSAIAALAPGAPLALAGIAIAGLGTSVCAPTLLSLAGRLAGPDERASAVSIVTTIAYLGFLVGPAVVGLLADAASLRAALVAVGGLALLLAALVRFAPGPQSGL